MKYMKTPSKDQRFLEEYQSMNVFFTQAKINLLYSAGRGFYWGWEIYTYTHTCMFYSFSCRLNSMIVLANSFFMPLIYHISI